MMHPSGNLEREYAVRVLGQATPRQLQTMLNGVNLDDGPDRFADIVDTGGKGRNHWYHVVLMEGRNREVRRLWESQGLTISRLIRVRFGNYILPRRKKTGECWELDKKTVDMLLELLYKEKMQLFITATDPEEIIKENIETALFHVEQGRVKRC